MFTFCDSGKGGWTNSKWIAGFVLSITAVPAFGAPPLIAVRAKRMLDVRRGVMVSDPVILIENGRIKALGSGLAIPAGAEITELGDTTLLPGLIDCHTHLLQNFDPRFWDELGLVRNITEMSTASRALLGVKTGREDLEAGITTVRDVGNSGLNGAVAFRDAIQAGWFEGPRVVACGRALSPIGGQFAPLPPAAQGFVDQEYVPINGVEEARKAVRQSLYEGADCIKVIVDQLPLILSVEELKAIVLEAHRLGKKVAAHAIADQAVDNAIEAGVDSIEHAYTLTDAQAKLMAVKGIFLVPTDHPRDAYMYGMELTPEQRKRGEYNFGWLTRHNRERLQRAMKAGVRIAAGSDSYQNTTPITRGQASRTMFAAYAEAGMSNLEVIRTGTTNAAELIGLAKDLGSLEPGKYADIIAVTGDPLKDIHMLEKVRFVMKAGKIEKNTQVGD